VILVPIAPRQIETRSTCGRLGTRDATNIASVETAVLQNLPTYPKGIRGVCFLLHRVMSRRPAYGRSADRGLSTGV